MAYSVVYNVITNKGFNMLSRQVKESSALEYLNKILPDGATVVSPDWDNMDRIIQKCSNILNIKGTWVYNFPLTPQYDVYNGELHCFEVYSSELENDVVMLTVNESRFDSRNYDSKKLNNLKNLWDRAKSVNKKPWREIQKQYGSK